jgi:uroporphyrinogen-III synthase
MSAVLVLRPEPGAGRTARRLAAMGLSPIVYPLFTVEAVDWAPPDPAAFDAILLTSANAARLGGPGLACLHDLPVYAVGAATARAALDAGFGTVNEGGGDAAATVPLLVHGGHVHVLHLCGDSVRAFDPQGLKIAPLAVYRTMAIGDAAGLAALLPPTGRLRALVHSPRAGKRLAELIAPAVQRRISIAAISAAAVHACGPGWRAVSAAVRPDEEAMLQCLQTLV